MASIKLIDFIHDISEESNWYKIDFKDNIRPELVLADDNAEAQKYCEKLINILNRKNAIEGNGTLTLHFNWEPSPRANLELKLQGSLLQTLVEICGKAIKFEIVGGFDLLKNLDYECLRSKQTTFASSLEIMSPSVNEAYGEYQHAEASSGAEFSLNLRLYKFLKVDIYIKVEDLYLPDLDLDQLAVVCKTIQDNKRAIDIAVLANSTDGECPAVLWANKAFLMAHSPVLKALIEDNFASSVIEMNFTRECVQALLDYMFTTGFEAAVKSSRLAVELFQASHHYQIQHLEDKLVEMLLRRASSWFEADAAIELFKAATRIEIHSSAELKKKAVEIVKSKGNLQGSANLGKLLDKDRNTGLELIAMALEN